MADHTKIEWADATVNAVNGCSVISPGCTNCYAMKLAGTRLRNHPTRAGLTDQTKAGPVWNGQVRLNEEHLLQPLIWQRPRQIFWNAHGDLFHDAVPDEWIDRVLAVCALTPQHQHLILTKRSDRMRAYFAGLEADDIGRKSQRITQATNFVMLASGRSWGKLGSTGTYITTTVYQTGAREPEMIRGTGDGGVERLIGWRDGERWARCSDAYAARVPDWLKNAPEGGWAFKEWPLPNVWLGVSVEDQTRADQRISDLLATPAAVRWISAEPLLGPVNLNAIKMVDYVTSEGGSVQGWESALNGKRFDEWSDGDSDGWPKLDWVVVGGESGKSARPMHPDWPRSLRDQCAAAGVPFFFKQWGEWVEVDEGPYNFRMAPNGERCIGSETVNGAAPMRKVGKKAAGRLLDGIEHNAMPEGRS